MSMEKLINFVKLLEKEKFTVLKYNLVTHNCHDFSKILSMFLLKKDIPKEYLNVGQRTITRTVPIFGRIIDAIKDRKN